MLRGLVNKSCRSTCHTLYQNYDGLGPNVMSTHFTLYINHCEKSRGVQPTHFEPGYLLQLPKKLGASRVSCLPPKYMRSSELRRLQDNLDPAQRGLVIASLAPASALIYTIRTARLSPPERGHVTYYPNLNRFGIRQSGAVVTAQFTCDNGFEDGGYAGASK